MISSVLHSPPFGFLILAASEPLCPRCPLVPCDLAHAAIVNLGHVYTQCSGRRIPTKQPISHSTLKSPIKPLKKFIPLRFFPKCDACQSATTNSISRQHCVCKLAPCDEIFLTSMVCKHTPNLHSCDVNKGIHRKVNPDFVTQQNVKCKKMGVF